MESAAEATCGSGGEGERSLDVNAEWQRDLDGEVRAAAWLERLDSGGGGARLGRGGEGARAQGSRART
jgi:hypothetical protein